MKAESDNIDVEDKNKIKPEYIDGIVADLVKKHIDRELGIIKDSGGIALKILGASLAIFVTIFTIFGISTWNDIKKETSQFVKNKTDGLLNNNDTNAGIKSNLNHLLNLSIVNSYLIELSKPDIRELELRESEWSRVKSWLKDERLGLQEFKDALTILDGQADERKRKDVFEFLAEMVSPVKDSQYAWIRKQPDKILAILENFKHVNIGSSAVRIVTSDRNTEDLRIAAVKYIKELEYTEGNSELVDYARSLKKGKLWSEVIIACASLDPLDEGFIEEVDSLLQLEFGSNRIRTVLGIVIEMSKVSSNHQVDESTLNRIDKFSEKLLLHAINLGAYVQIEKTDRYRWHNSDKKYESLEDVKVQIWYPTSQGGASGMFFGSIVDLKEWENYWQLVEKLATDGDIDRFKNMIPRISIFAREYFPEKGIVPIYIKAEPDESSFLIVENEFEGKISLTNENMSEIKIFPANRKRVVTVEWKSKEGALMFGRLISFDGKVFEFRPTLKLSD